MNGAHQDGFGKLHGHLRRRPRKNSPLAGLSLLLVVPSWCPSLVFFYIGKQLVALLFQAQQRHSHMVLQWTTTIRHIILPQIGGNSRKRNTKHSPERRQGKPWNNLCPHRISTSGRWLMQTGYLWLPREAATAAAAAAAAVASSGMVSSDCFESCM